MIQRNKSYPENHLSWSFEEMKAFLSYAYERNQISESKRNIILSLIKKIEKPKKVKRKAKVSKE